MVSNACNDSRKRYVLYQETFRDEMALVIWTDTIFIREFDMILNSVFCTKRSAIVFFLAFSF